jgi:hypothetical protein
MNAHITERIRRAIDEFVAEESRRPNILIVGGDAEAELFRLGIKPTAIYQGMRIMVDDGEADLSVAYRKP